MTLWYAHLSVAGLQLEFPPVVGSEDLIKATRLGIREARIELKSAGFDLGERLRVAPTVSQARTLGVDGRPPLGYRNEIAPSGRGARMVLDEETMAALLDALLSPTLGHPL